MLLSPAQVHAQQHFGEVGRVHSPGASANRHDRGARVKLAVEQGLHLEVAHHLLHGCELGVHIGRSRLIRLFVRELNHDLEVVESLFDARNAGELTLPVTERGGDALGFLCVVPEVWHAGLLTQIGNLGGESIDANHRADVGKRGAEGSYLLGNIQLDHVVVSLPEGTTSTAARQTGRCSSAGCATIC